MGYKMKGFRGFKGGGKKTKISKNQQRIVGENTGEIKTDKKGLIMV